MDRSIAGHMDGVLTGHKDGVLPGHMDGVLLRHLNGLLPGHQDPGSWMGFCPLQFSQGSLVNVSRTHSVADVSVELSWRHTQPAQDDHAVVPGEHIL